MTERQLSILQYLARFGPGYQIPVGRARQVGRYASGGAAHWAVDQLVALGFVAVAVADRPRKVTITALGRAAVARVKGAVE